MNKNICLNLKDLTGGAKLDSIHIGLIVYSVLTTCAIIFLILALCNIYPFSYINRGAIQGVLQDATKVVPKGAVDGITNVVDGVKHIASQGVEGAIVDGVTIGLAAAQRAATEGASAAVTEVKDKLSS